MAEPTPIAVAARLLLERKGIDPDAALPDDNPATDRDELLEHVTAAVPLRYREAWPTNDTVAMWAQGLADTAIGYAAEHGKPATFVRCGRSLLILGSTGTGKTYEAFGAIRHLAAAGVRTGFVALNVADLYARLRPRSGVDAEGEFGRVANAPLLFIDDLGAAKGSEWTEEINYRLINHRYEAELPTLLTSNLAPADLGIVLGSRVSSRLVEMCDRAVLKGNDRRRTP